MNTTLSFPNNGTITNVIRINQTYLIEMKHYLGNCTETANTIKTYGGSNYDIFTQEGLNYDVQNEAFIRDSIDKRHNIDHYISDNKQKIPLITHQAYFTASNNLALKKILTPFL